MPSKLNEEEITQEGLGRCIIPIRATRDKVTERCTILIQLAIYLSFQDLMSLLPVFEFLSKLKWLAATEPWAKRKAKYNI